MTVGTVKWFDASKGYGSILTADGKDVFVHFSEIRCSGFRTLTRGEEVEFEIRESERGFHAANVNRH
jgi:CspA family cold shock protein